MYKALQFASKVLTLYEEEMRRRKIRKRLCSAVRLYAHAQFNFYIVFVCNAIHNIPLLSAVTEKRVSVPEAHKILNPTFKKIEAIVNGVGGVNIGSSRKGFIRRITDL